MGECEKLSTCKFFEFYKSGDQRQQALKGFANLYCRGEKQNECKRKKVGVELGGPDKVPANMMPNGLPLPGEDRAKWPEDVIKIVS